MKKSLTIVILLVLAVSILFALPGCGSDAGQAKEYTKSAMENMNKANDKSDQLETEANTGVASVFSGQTIDKAKWDELSKKFNAGLDEMKKYVNAGKADFKKIKGLKGVDKYIEVADYYLKAVAQDEVILQLNYDLMNYLDNFVASGAIDASTVTTLQNKLDEMEQKEQEAKTKFNEYNSKAEQIWNENNLGQ